MGGTFKKGKFKYAKDYHPGQPRRRRDRHPAGTSVWEAIRSGQLPDSRPTFPIRGRHRAFSGPARFHQFVIRFKAGVVVSFRTNIRNRPSAAGLYMK